ncbi:FAD-dependent oxidoreductase [Azohydromonas australica]|uniref:FAD-dependent oxidoreductase n=1 Tax=Azohydromonas australica TaxID=364039 RepID=UPI00040F88F7|nr:FAD-dependent oxidoreductase [Azohydromonas australica]
MMRRIERVCVVGAGLTGLACALAAARHGLQVTVLDAMGAPRSMPAHVNVMPNMLRELLALGVAGECARLGFVYHGIDVVDRVGRVLVKLSTERLAGPLYPAALGIELDVLLQVLTQAAQRAGVTLLRNASVQDVRRRRGQPWLQVASGDEMPCDLVLLAGGAQTPLRTALFPLAQPPRTDSQAWWYTTVQRPVRLDRPCMAMGRKGHKVHVVPVRADRASVVLVEPIQDAVSVPMDEASAHLRRSLAAFAPQVRELALQVHEGTEVIRRPIFNGLLDDPWSPEGVLAVGTCAHAIPPHFGQSAALGFEDAVVLGELLAQTRDAEALVKAFTARRLPRVRRIHEITSMAARWDAEPEPSTDLQALSVALGEVVARQA